MNHDAWNDGRIADLRRFFENGLSAAAIAKELTISRGAVISKLHRLGLRRGAQSARQRSPEEILAAKQRRRDLHNIAQNKRRNAARETRGSDEPQRKPSPSVLPTPQPDYAPLRISFSNLESFGQKKPNQCRFILNDASPFIACGAVTAPGESWCAHCRDIVFTRSAPVLSEQERFRRAMNYKAKVIKLPSKARYIGDADEAA